MYCSLILDHRKDISRVHTLMSYFSFPCKFSSSTWVQQNKLHLCYQKYVIYECCNTNQISGQCAIWVPLYRTDIYCLHGPSPAPGCRPGAAARYLSRTPVSRSHGWRGSPDWRESLRRCDLRAVVYIRTPVSWKGTRYTWHTCRSLHMLNKSIILWSLWTVILLQVLF